MSIILVLALSFHSGANLTPDLTFCCLSTALPSTSPFLLIFTCYQRWRIPASTNHWYLGTYLHV